MLHQKRFAIFLVIVICLVLVINIPGLAQAGATITVVNLDGPGEGFNDPTPVPPVGENTGTTLGEQRFNAFQRAADIWGSLLDSSVENASTIINKTRFFIFYSFSGKTICRPILG